MGEFVEYEYRIVRPDGEVRWIEAHVFPVRNEEGEIYRCAGSAQEITKRKRAGGVSRISTATVNSGG